MEKSEIRKIYKAKRKALSEVEHNQLSQKICTRIFESFSLENKTISLFLPIKRLHEIDTFKVLKNAQKMGCRIGLPTINSDGKSMTHFRFEKMEDLKENALGIPELSDGEIILPSEFDFVFVPLLALDSKGNRVGYGKGFYDRFLTECSQDCKFIGLHYFNEFTEIDDLSPLDRPLHYLISPTKTDHF
jgi:5-formyltetrahydrofolate cyclo-ligase